MSSNSEDDGPDDAKRRVEPREQREIEALIARTTERTRPELDALVQARIRSEFDAASLELESSGGGGRGARGGERRLALVAASLAAAVVLVLLGFEFRWFGGPPPLDLPGGPTPVATTETPGASPAPESETQLTPKRTSSSDEIVPAKAAHAEPDRATESATDPSAALARETTSGSDGIVPRTSGGLPANLDAKRTATISKTLARMRPLPDGDPRSDVDFHDPGEGVLLVEITSVYKGEATLVQNRVELYPGTDGTRHSFLGWDERAKKEFWKKGASFVASLEPIPTSRRNLGPGASGAFRVVLGEGFAVTLLSADLPDVGPFVDDARVVQQLLADLVESLDDGSAAVRESAITALLHSDDPEIEDSDPNFELWKDDEIASRLLARMSDSSPRVRWNLALLANPAFTGARGVIDALELDPVPLVRRAAESSRDGRRAASARKGRSPGMEGDPALRDPFFDERHSRSIVTTPVRVTDARDVERAAFAVVSHDSTPTRVHYAEALESTGRVGGSTNVAVDALTRALRDHDFEVRRAAAESLGRLGDRSVINELHSIRANDDPRLLVAAGGAQVRLLDARGVGRLRQVAHASDARASMQAFVVIGELIGDLSAEDEAELQQELIRLLFEAIEFDDSPPGIVRAEALLRLATVFLTLDDSDRIRFYDWVQRCAASPSGPLQLAARLAPAFISMTPSEQELRRLEELGYAVGGQDALKMLGY